MYFVSVWDRARLAIALWLLRSTLFNVVLELREVPKATKRNVIGRVLSRHVELDDALDALENTKVGEGYYNALWLRAFVGSRDDLLVILERRHGPHYSDPDRPMIVPKNFAGELMVAADDGWPDLEPSTLLRGELGTMEGVLIRTEPVEEVKNHLTNAMLENVLNVGVNPNGTLHACNTEGPMKYAADDQYRPSCTICGNPVIPT